MKKSGLRISPCFILNVNTLDVWGRTLFANLVGGYFSVDWITGLEYWMDDFYSFFGWFD